MYCARCFLQRSLQCIQADLLVSHAYSLCMACDFFYRVVCSACRADLLCLRCVLLVNCARCFPQRSPQCILADLLVCDACLLSTAREFYHRVLCGARFWYVLLVYCARLFLRSCLQCIRTDLLVCDACLLSTAREFYHRVLCGARFWYVLLVYCARLFLQSSLQCIRTDLHVCDACLLSTAREVYLRVLFRARFSCRCATW